MIMTYDQPYGIRAVHLERFVVAVSCMQRGGRREMPLELLVSMINPMHGKVKETAC